VSTHPDYEGLELVYESSNSAVFLATCLVDGASVVLKQAHPSSEPIASLRHEFALLTTLRDRGVTGVPEARALLGGHPPQRTTLVLRSVGAQSLMSLMVSRTFELRMLLELARHVALILEDVHGAGITHKDISPSNIVWAPESGTVQIIDFGIASERMRESVDGTDDRIIRGTLAYMAPEQTGRMNRDVDYRTDLYALGATLYHLLGGRPPFQERDPLALVHAHIARRPEPLHAINPAIPSVVSAVIGRLLEKRTEDRYQSAASLAADLGECIRQWVDRGRIDEFGLGRTEQRVRFVMPQTLYGRHHEVERLEAGFATAVAGGRALLLVGGESGIGKSRLLREIHPALASRGALVGTGKCHQLGRSQPYRVLLAAIGGILRSFLALPERDLLVWRERIAAAVAPNACVLVEVVPELGHILGPCAQVPEVPPIEARNRFRRTFVQLARTLADARHPLVLFIDDLQWVDASSLKLLEAILVDASVGHLLVVGTYRDNEVGELHPLELQVSELVELGLEPVRLALGPLAVEHVRALLMDALQLPATELGALAELVHAKTDGNPFLVETFLDGLLGEKLLFYDREVGRWAWTFAAARYFPVGDGAQDLLAKRVAPLPARSRNMVRLAACIGNPFDLRLLAAIAEQPIERTAAALRPAITANLLAPLGSTWDLVEHGHEPEQPILLGFQHDRVQEASYALLPEDERPAVHLRIARLLEADRDDEDRLFDLVDQLTRAIDLLDARDRKNLVRYLLKAASRARHSAAHATALDLSRRAVGLLDADAWHHDPELATECTLAQATAAYSNADFSTLDESIDTVLAHGKDALARLRGIELRISARVHQNRPHEAISVARAALRELGVDLPETPGPADLCAALERTQAAIGTRTIEALGELAPLQDPLRAATGRLLTGIASASYVAAPALFPLTVLEQITLFAAHGATSATAYALTTFGIIQAGVVGNLDDTYACALASERLLERFEASEVEGRSRYVSHAYLRPWKEPLSQIWSGFPAIYQRCMDVGDVEYAAWAAMMRVIYGVFLGHPLGDSLADAERWTTAIAELGQDTALGYAQISLQVLRHLAGLDPDALLLRGEVYDAPQRLPSHLERGDAFAVCSVHLHRLLLAILLDAPTAATAAAKAVRDTLPAITALAHVPVFQVLDALHCCDRVASGIESPAVASELTARADAHLIALRTASHHAAHNHEHRALLVTAELLAVRQDAGGAAACFEDALQCARRHGFSLDEGLIAQRAARFYVRIGNPTVATAYATEARRTWDRIGALGLRTHVLRTFPGAASRDAAPIDLRAARSITATSDHLDFHAMLKTTQALSEALRIEELLERTCAVLLESGGAERVVLVLLHAGVPRVEAWATTSGERATGPEALDDRAGLPHGVLHYVLRTAERVVLDDAANFGAFTSEPYIASTRAKSVLCMPILRQGKLLGALYLENNLLSAAFTIARLETLAVLASSAAISIENAKLYETLEEKVTERTHQLERRNHFIREVFGRYLTDEVVDSLLDEHNALELGGQQRQVTVLMSDIRGFTTLSANLPPADVVSMLNLYLSHMTRVVMRYQGTIDEFIGDAILVVFGAPVLRADDARRALCCALAMQHAMAEINLALAQRALPTLEMGIGIATSEVVVGNIGSEIRAKYGVVGPAVNVAARIEARTTGGEILMDAATLEQVRDEVRVDATQVFELKGFPRPVEVFEVGGMRGRPELDLPMRRVPWQPLPEPLRLSYALLQGNADRGRFREARLVAVAPRGLLLDGCRTVGERSEIQLRLDGAEDGLLYAKVVEVMGDRLALRITAASPLACRALEELRRAAVARTHS